MASGTFYPAANGDDGDFGTGGFHGTNTYLAFGSASGTPVSSFVRFPSVNIPAGAVITAAYIRFQSTFSDGNTTCNVNVHFNAADNAVAPTDEAEAEALSLTDPVAWDDIAAWTAGSNYDTPSLVDILQDVIDRPGWASGHALMPVLKDNSSSSGAVRRPYANDHATGACPELHVEWTAGVNVQAECETLSLTTYAATISAPVEVDASCASLSIAAHAPAVFWGTHVQASAASLTATANAASIKANTNALASCATLTLTANQALISYDIAIQADYCALSVSTGKASVFDGAAWDAWISAHSHEITRYYYLTLTGEADGLADLTLPMSSFQCRRRSGDPTYLSAVIPGTDYYDAIAARSNGELIIDMAYSLNGVIAHQEELVRADYEVTRKYEGGRNQSLVVEGHQTESWATKTLDLHGVSYMAIDDGLYRIRCAAPEMYLQPGDTARYGVHEFTVAEIVMAISPEYASVDITEEE